MRRMFTLPLLKTLFSKVIANPNKEFTAALNKVEIDGVVYSVGTKVEGNPVEDATTLLEKLKVGNDVFSIPPKVTANVEDETSGMLEKLKVGNDVYGIPEDITLNQYSNGATQLRNVKKGSTTLNVFSTDISSGHCQFIQVNDDFSPVTSFAQRIIKLLPIRVEFSDNRRFPYIAYPFYVSTSDIAQNTTYIYVTYKATNQIRFITFTYFDTANPHITVSAIN